MRFARSIAALFVFLTSPAWPQSPPGQVVPVVKPQDLRKISAHVHIIPDNDVSLVANIGFVIGENAVLVIDTGLGPPNGAPAAEVASILGGRRPLYLVTTHVHPEHDLGATGFPADIKMIRSAAQVREIAETGMSVADTFRKLSEHTARLLERAAFRRADITYESEYRLDLGGAAVRIMAVGPTHTLGDTVAWVEADGVLFSGDTAMHALPAFASPHSSLSHWLGTLDRLEALGPAQIVPSHGPVGEGTEFISAYRRYLSDVRDLTAAQKRAGASVDQAIARVSATLMGQYLSNRMAGAIRAAYAEAR